MASNILRSIQEFIEGNRSVRRVADDIELTSVAESVGTATGRKDAHTPPAAPSGPSAKSWSDPGRRSPTVPPAAQDPGVRAPWGPPARPGRPPQRTTSSTTTGR